MKVRLSIRYKILLVVTALLVASIGLYLFLATSIFRKDKLALVYSLNESLVSTVAAEVDTTLQSVVEKLKLFAAISGSNADSKSKLAFQDIISNDQVLVRLELYESGHQTPKLLTQISQNDFMKLYKVEETFFDAKLPKQRPIPFNEIQAETVRVWNATVQDGPPILGVGLSVIQEGPRGVPEKMMAAVGYIKSDQFLKNLRSSRLAQAFIVDPVGKILVHPKMEYMTSAADFSASPIVAELQKSQATQSAMRYSFSGRDQLGAFAKVGLGNLAVVSQIDSAQAFYAVRRLFTQSALFAIFTITATFLATIFFSRTLTHPIQRLASAMEKVSEGNLDAGIKIRSHDEIASLSKSFNRMIQDLRTSRGQLEEINRDLEQKVLDRTKKLEEQNRAVKEAQEALLRTTRLASVGEIAGRTAHEVLNPLTSLMTRIQKVQKRLQEDLNDKNLLGEIVKGWAEEFDKSGTEGLIKSLTRPSTVKPEMPLLKEDLMNLGDIFSRWDSELSTLQKDTQFLMREANRIEKILKQMRSLSVVRSSKTKMNAHAVLHEAVNISADLFSKSSVQLLENYQAQNDVVSIDRDELIQVLTNLLRNALHAVEEKSDGSPKVVVETSNGDKSFKIDIVDNGIGIKEENQQKLFVSQFSTKSPNLGTGLGLSISRRFVRAFDGDLFLVSSRFGETRFRIELPLEAVKKESNEVAA